MKLLYNIKITPLLFILLLIPLSEGIGQKERIVKIIDSNLFELRSGKLIKLAGIDVPNLNHPDLKLRNVAYDAHRYAKNLLLNRKFDVTCPDYSPIDTNFSLVYLVREYPLLTRNFTEEYLKRGYGKFYANVEGIDSSKYLISQREAKEDKEGIWEFMDSHDYKFDQHFTEFEIKSEEWIDSVETFTNPNSFLGNLSQSERIFMEIIGAPLVGVPSIFIGGVVGVGISWIGGAEGIGMYVPVIIGAYIGYSLGNATGVYIAAKHGNKNVKYGTTLLAGFLGGLTATAILSFSHNQNGYPVLGNIGLATLPAIAAIIYVNLIAPDKPKHEFSNWTPINNPKIKESLSHKEFYNSSKIFDLEVMRINF